MDATQDSEDSIFTTIPREVLVDLLSLLPTSSVINFYLVSSPHLKLFDTSHGLWEQLTRKIFHWSASALPHTNEVIIANAIDWKKEFKIASFFNTTIRNSQIHPNSSKESLSKLQTIDKYHFKVSGATNEDIEGVYCSLQSQIKMYPLPIGNFKTAYFEVEVIDVGTSNDFDLVIGGAIEGFIGYVGNSLTSYGYSSDGGIYLECDLTLKEEPEEFAFQSNDVVGFGINFGKQSVFFTKNGNLIYETSKNFNDERLLELENLHATVSLHNQEVKVNLGSHPFVFDLLKYQQQHAQTPLEFYSNVVVEHLLSAFELSKIDNIEDNLSPCYSDRNIPPFKVRLPDFLYLLLYGRIPPKSKYANASENQQNILIQWDMMRIVLNSSERLCNMNTKQSKSALDMIEGMSRGFELDESLNSRPWQERCMAVLNKTMESFGDILLYFMFEFVEDITAMAFDYSNVSSWALYLLAAVEFGRDRPGGLDHWTKQFSMSIVSTNGELLHEIFQAMVATVLYFRRILVKTSVIAQRCKYLAQVKTDEFKQMKAIFGENKRLNDGYKALIEDLFQKSASDPLFFMDVPHSEYLRKIEMQVLAHNVINGVDDRPRDVVFYGIYKLKISPNDFSSLKDYVQEVFKQNEKLITDEMKHEYLQDLLSTLDLEFDDETVSFEAAVISPLRVIYGVEISTNGDTDKLKQRVQKNIERMLENKNYGRHSSTKSLATKSTNTSLIVGAVAAIGAICLGAFFLRKKFTK